MNQLVRFLHNVDVGVTAGTSVEFLEQVVIVLGLILDSIEDREGLKNSMLKGKKQSLDSLLLVLQRGSLESKIASARVLQFVAVDAEAKISIAEKESVVAELLKSAAPEKDAALIEAALASLVAISAPKRNKLKLVNLGAVKAMKRLLKEANLGAAAVEKVLKENENGRVDDNENGKLRVEENFIDLGLSKLVQLKCATSVTESGKTMFSKTVKKNDVVKYF